MAGERDALVVGAGMVGLACAERLAQANVNFLVLETANRIGGRVLTGYTVACGRSLG
jgi:flavin-dependent dehydrogenase